MFRSLLCTQITALTHLENFTWLFICGTNWLFFGTIWLGTNGPDSEGQGRGDWRERDGKAPSLRRVSLSLFSLPFLPFSSVSFFENYLSKKIIYQILALFYAKCVRLHAHWNHLLENFTSYFIYVEIYRLFAQKNFSELRWTTQFSISWLIMNRTLDDKIVPMSKFNRRLRAM